MTSRRAIVSTLALLTVIAGTGIDAVTGWPPAMAAAGGALVVYVVLEGRRADINGRLMLAAVAVTVVAALSRLPDPGRVLGRALAEAASLVGLFTALSFMREAAEGSPLVKRCGDLMVRQPPGRRYLVISLGSHLVSLVLNFGVLSLLGTMVMRGNTAEAAGGDQRVVAIRSRRMMSALLRGFSVMTVWSPLSVSFAVTQTVVHGLPWNRLLPLQMGLAGLQLAHGWIIDRLAFPPVARPAGDGAVGGWGALGRLALLIWGVMAASVVVAELLGVRMVMGAVLVVPWAGLAWLAAQRRGNPATAMVSAAALMARRLTVILPGFATEVAMLGGGMFAGTVVAAFIAPAEVAHLIGRLGLPPLPLTILLAWSVMALAQVGVSQIVTVTVLGGALANLGQFGVDPLVLASGLMGAWALSACSTPVGAAILTVSRLAGVPLMTVARDWNGRYVLQGGLLLALWMSGLHWLLR